MKLFLKLSLLALLSLTMVACNGTRTKNTKPPVVEESGNKGNDGVVTTKPLVGVSYGGRIYKTDCCTPDNLTDPDNLLSQRVIFFAYDQATVESQYRELIALHARYLSENPSASIVLEGHADERGTPEYNLALGEKRAKSVANLMRAQGASAGQISVVSFGEEEPVALCNNESCWSQNRRVRIVYNSK